MGIFAPRAHRTTPPGVGDRTSGFEAVAEAMAGEGDLAAGCAVVGRDLARSGADLGEALDGLRATARRIAGRDPGFETVRALGTAWAEETLSYLHQLSCEDPLTGLATLAHLHARLAETYRAAEDRPDALRGRALVVLDVPARGADRFDRALRLARLAETVRLVFPGDGTLSRARRHRLLLLTGRTADLGRKVADLRLLLGDLEREPGESRVWIEGLPPTADSAASLLDELAR